jgi:RNA polymerase sigma-70 factor, ECF subfamily
VSRVAAVSPATGLDALWAAIAEVRAAELRPGGRQRAFTWCTRATTPGGRDPLRSAGTAASTAAAQAGRDDAPTLVVPAPAAAADDAGQPGPPPPEGDAASSLRLVQRAQSGDAEAFGELYDRYVDVVYRYVSYRVSSRQLAEDLTSETFLRALRRISSFSWQGRDVGAWFVTIARNLIADHYKSSRYRLEMTTDDVSVATGVPRDGLVESSPEHAVVESMQNKVLLEAVKKLNPEQQECIALRFLQGLSVAETAAVMGKNEGAIKALQYRAVRTLGRLLPEGVEL